LSDFLLWGLNLWFFLLWGFDDSWDVEGWSVTITIAIVPWVIVIVVAISVPIIWVEGGAKIESLVKVSFREGLVGGEVWVDT